MQLLFNVRQILTQVYELMLTLLQKGKPAFSNLNFHPINEIQFGTMKIKFTIGLFISLCPTLQPMDEACHLQIRDYNALPQQQLQFH